MSKTRRPLSLIFFITVFELMLPAQSPAAKPQKQLPRAVGRAVDFHTDVLPILARRCTTCHASGRREGGLSLETRKTLLRGGNSGAVVIPGKSEQSLLIKLVAGHDPDRIMPEQGKRLSADEVGLLRGWIDQGVKWDGDISLRRLTLQTWKPRNVTVEDPDQHPLDQLLREEIQRGEPVEASRFIRRVWLDSVGLLPSPDDVDAFVTASEPLNDQNVQKLVDSMLANNHGYAQHWMTFWNDHLRNAYVGTGFIDGGRKSITNWLYQSLLSNKPFDKFVYELIAAAPGAEGFTKGIIWRGRVNASQRPPLQAAQTISQVFLGLNLKCASCHDSFVSQWTLKDAYGLAAVFSDSELQIFECDKETGQTATPAFFNSEIGSIEKFAADRPARQKQLAELLINENNARLTRTIVNRIWARLMGRGLIEPVDEMDNKAWNDDVLDWLANDLREHGYDLKHTIRTIMTSKAYRLAAVAAAEDDDAAFVFKGPLAKRMTAEQFLDAIYQITKTGPQKPGGKNVPKVSLKDSPGFIRAAITISTPLMRSLGRPNREQVVTTRPAQLTTLQALDLTNGDPLAKLIETGAASVFKQHSEWTDAVPALFRSGLARAPNAAERDIAAQIFADDYSQQSLGDFLWMLIMLPEFQLVL